MLQVERLEVSYGRSQALFGVSVEVHRGEVVVLLGRNGAGKTTTMKTIMGILRPTRGSVRFNDEELAARRSCLICRRGIGYVPEDRRIFPELTVMENLDVGRKPAQPGFTVEWDLDRVLELFPRLRELLPRRGGRLSGGEQQMLTIARSLMGNPQLLLLDEPSEGLAPLVIQMLGDQIGLLKQQGLTILLAEQNFYFASKISDRAYVLDMGEVKFGGSMKELQEHPEITSSFLMA
ncbi:MAG: ABC transporter ATP-binding protein [Dehalococcoidia bacterium]|nr:ABC transporter ATP-binding protein [Dehalococcoidia bacterium]